MSKQEPKAELVLSRLERRLHDLTTGLSTYTRNKLALGVVGALAERANKFPGDSPEKKALDLRRRLRMMALEFSYLTYCIEEDLEAAGVKLTWVNAPQGARHEMKPQEDLPVHWPEYY